MADNNKDFKEYLHDEMLKDAGELPVSLSQQNITDLVNGTPQTKKKGIAKKVISIAASFAIIFVAAIVGIKLYKPQVKPIAPVEKSDSKVYTSNYAEIQSFFKSLKSQMRYEAFSDSANINFFFGGSRSKDSIIEYNAAGIAEAPTSQSTTQSTATASHSKTDLQVEGVDEADIVKNDGKYLYVINGTSQNSVIIADPSDPKNIKIASEIELDMSNDYNIYAHEMFVKDDLLVVITANHPKTNIDAYREVYTGCYYMGSSGEKLGVLIYDIKDRTKPVLKNSYELDGSYVTARMTDAKLLLISNYCVPLLEDDKELEKACIPSYWVNGKQYSMPAEKISIIKDNKDDTYTLVMQLDPNSDNEPETAAILGGTNDVYCNNTDLYLARTEYEENSEKYSVSTGIYRFSLTDGAQYKSSCQIKGDILNQFSMDEYNGYFRIATSDFNEESYITVLDKELNLVGQLSGIGKGEDIYAVRFMGDTAYVVTFYQTDPLFVIDLSNPEAPEIVGELKIPGFSNMLYPYGENKLIGIGVDGDEKGSNGKLKVSLFDISDRKNPKEISKAIFGEANYSEAQYNHKAFMYFGDTDEFAIPVVSYGYDTSNYLCSFRIEGDKITQYKKYEPESKFSDIQRGAYIGDTVFTVSDNVITAFDRQSTQLLSDITLSDITFVDTTEPVIVIN